MTQKVLIVEARFYDQIADDLLQGAQDVLQSAGIAFDTIKVPGSYEIPGAIAMAYDGDAENYDGYLALGCVIRGETSHYDHICDSVAMALQNLATQQTLAIGFGLLTCENKAQAEIRADPKQKNYGGNAARAVVEMMKLKQNFLSPH